MGETGSSQPLSTRRTQAAEATSAPKGGREYIDVGIVLSMVQGSMAKLQLVISSGTMDVLSKSMDELSNQQLLWSSKIKQGVCGAELQKINAYLSNIQLQIGQGTTANQVVGSVYSQLQSAGQFIVNIIAKITSATTPSN